MSPIRMILKSLPIYFASLVLLCFVLSVIGMKQGLLKKAPSAETDTGIASKQPATQVFHSDAFEEIERKAQRAITERLQAAQINSAKMVATDFSSAEINREKLLELLRSESAN